MQVRQVGVPFRHPKWVSHSAHSAHSASHSATPSGCPTFCWSGRNGLAGTATTERGRVSREAESRDASGTDVESIGTPIGKAMGHSYRFWRDLAPYCRLLTNIDIGNNAWQCMGHPHQCMGHPHCTGRNIEKEFHSRNCHSVKESGSDLISKGAHWCLEGGRELSGHRHGYRM